MIRETDPATTALVFNCGMGAVRTTFAMAAACIIRRKQLIVRGMDDPYVSKAVVPKPMAVSVRLGSLLSLHGLTGPGSVYGKPGSQSSQRIRMGMTG